MIDNQPIAIGKRFVEFRKKIKFTQKQMSDTLKLPQSLMSRVERGESNISSNMLTAITDNFPNLNIHWLWTGVGKMRVGKKMETYEAPIKIITLLEKSKEDIDNIIKLAKGAK